MNDNEKIILPESVQEEINNEKKDNVNLNKEHVEIPTEDDSVSHIPPKKDKHIHSSFSHGDGEKKDLVYIVYILYILGYVTGIANLIGVVLAYIVKDPEQPITYSHYQEQIKIFWISLIGFVVGLLTVHIFLGVLILIFTYIWVIVKTIKGLLLLNKDKPFPKGQFL